MDVDNAFYRIALPSGLSELFRLPAVDMKELHAIAPDLALDITSRRGTPRWKRHGTNVSFLRIDGEANASWGLVAVGLVGRVGS